MNWNRVLSLLLLVATMLSIGCVQKDQSPDLVGAWKSRIQFETGAFAAIKDLEFMYVFNAGGTMTESSNYDAAPPVPPAYGIWRESGPNQYEARYEFYITRTPTPEEAASASGGWLPAGHGVLVETIALSKGGSSFTSKIRYQVFDQKGKPASGGGVATGHAQRIGFK